MSDILLLTQVVWEQKARLWHRHWPALAILTAMFLMIVSAMIIIFETLLWAWPVK